MNKKTLLVLTAVAVIVSGGIGIKSALAAYEEYEPVFITATVDPTLIAGDSLEGIYTFTITKPSGDNNIVKIKIENTGGFKINQDLATVTCPDKWSENVQPEYVECASEGESLINTSGEVSFKATAPQPEPGTDKNYSWVVITTDIFNQEYQPTPPVTTVDNTFPTVVIKSTVLSPTNITPIPVTVTFFNENVTGFELADIILVNGTSSNFSGVDDIYNFNLTPTGQGEVTVNILADVAQDRVLHGNIAAEQFNIVFDSTAPSISLIGADTMDLTVGDVYTELGATSTDNFDPSPIISIDSEVDTAVAGTYIITYTATDSAENTATITRTVNVITPTSSPKQEIIVGGGGGGGGGFIPPAPPVIPPIVPQVLGVAAFNFASDLGIGMSGSAVTELQKKLTSENVYSGPITGYFGSLTLAGVRGYQAKYGIRQTGFAGPLTRAKLNSSQVAGVSTSAATEALRTQIAGLQAQLVVLLQQFAQILQAQAAGAR